VTRALRRTGGSRLKTTILVLALLAAGVGLADTASATCYMEKHTIDPVKKDTGTPVDLVVVEYYETDCTPPPQ
jgi:hypothetical protein